MQNAHVVQSAETPDLKSVKCEFESRHGHQLGDAMTKRYIMPCFVSHKHQLIEDTDGYIIQASDYDTLLVEVQKLKDENASLKKQLEEASKVEAKPAKKKKSGPKYVLKVPIDEEDWITVTDLKTEEILTFDSKEEAEKAGLPYGVFKVEKM
jgi:6-phosphogluconolactonase (cycloisomerase 2 family)